MTEFKTRYLIGIDDTDNKESRGTGYNARNLGGLIESKNMGQVAGITRHQLLVDPRIPYTSQNSSACLEVITDDLKSLIELCRKFLLEVSAVGSDAGLAISDYDEVNEEIIDFGQRAKIEVLTQHEAIDLANNNIIYLEGLTGTRDGIIGALASLGLRKSGNDGRFISIEKNNIREVNGIFTAGNLKNITGTDEITDIYENEISDNELVKTGDWIRPVLKRNKKIIIVEKSITSDNHDWEITSKEYIRSISN